MSPSMLCSPPLPPGSSYFSTDHSTEYLRSASQLGKPGYLGSIPLLWEPEGLETKAPGHRGTNLLWFSGRRGRGSVESFLLGRIPISCCTLPAAVLNCSYSAKQHLEDHQGKNAVSSCYTSLVGLKKKFSVYTGSV